MIQALPWILLAVTLLALGIELLVSHRVYTKAQAVIADLLQQQQVDQDEIYKARKAYHVVRGERDLARDTVRNLVDIHRHAGLRPPATPLPMPPDVDDSLTEEFTQITGRHTWPKWPEKP